MVLSVVPKEVLDVVRRGAALRYYTRRTAETLRVGDLADPRAIRLMVVDFVMDFVELLRATSRDTA